MSEGEPNHDGIRIQGPDSSSRQIVSSSTTNNSQGKDDDTPSHQSGSDGKVRHGGICIRATDVLPPRRIMYVPPVRSTAEGDAAPLTDFEMCVKMTIILDACHLIDLIDDPDAWDTIIVCSIFGDLFGRALSSDEIATAINARHQRTGYPIGPDTVEYMLKMGEAPCFQRYCGEECPYLKWAAVKDRLVANKGISDPSDADMTSACNIYKETDMVLHLMATGEIEWPPKDHKSDIATRQQSVRKRIESALKDADEK